MGININDSTQDFTGQILRGEKTIETRKTRSLDPYIGERVGLVRTGVGKATLVGYATIGEPVVYDSVAKFRRDYDKHLVAPGSAFDMKDRLKYGYPLMQVESVEPREIESRGIVARRLNPATADDMPGGFLTQKHSAQIDTPAFKRWFNGSVIVDAYGGPRIMYHGTVWTDISKFESFRAQKGIAGFFAFDPAFAADFAKMYAEEYENEGVRKSPTVYPVYLSLKKVFDVRKKSDREEIDWEIQPGSLGWDWADLEDSVNAMKRAGFDGYIDFEFGSNKPPTGIAVFNPGDIKSAIGNRGTFDRADPDIRNPVNRDSDSAYLDAVRRGDMKAAQRMVDAAAKAAGFTVGPVWHGSDQQFNQFDLSKASPASEGLLFFSRKPRGYGKYLRSFYLRGVDRFVPDNGYATFRKKVGGRWQFSTDGSYADETVSHIGSDTLVVGDPAQIKSADPITYDDVGNVIPLSQRFNSQSDDIRNPYTRPDLRERLKRKIMAGSKGGNPGQWSARKAQLLAAEYEKAGGGYTGKRSASQKSLSKWTKQDWRTKSGKPSLETGERYLPAAAITALTSAEYAETSRAKRKAAGQFSRQPKRIAMKTSEYRNPMDPRSAMTQITGTEDTYINASKMLGGKVLDYGAGRGIGTDALRSNGLLADSFEPFPENWEGKRPPTYTDSANIPSDSYDSMVSFSVINVVDPDERKFLFQEVARILRPDGVALITGRDRQDVQKATTKIPHLEEGGYLIGKGKLQRYQKGFTQAELERYAKEVLGPGFTVETNRALNGASIKITKGKPNPAKRDSVRSKLSRIIEPGDRMLCYDTASGEDFYRLWDIIHTAMPMTKEALVEVEGMLDDDGVLVIESGESPAGLQDHFRKATRYNGLLLVQGPKNPEEARIETEKLRRELE